MIHERLSHQSNREQVRDATFAAFVVLTGKVFPFTWVSLEATESDASKASCSKPHNCNADARLAIPSASFRAHMSDKTNRYGAKEQI